MNKYFEPETVRIFYKTRQMTPTVTYAKMSNSDRDYLRGMCITLLEHIEQHKDSTQNQRMLYNWFFSNVQKKLPKPSKTSGIGKFNTWATFIQGMEHNFENTGTEDYSMKQLEHVEEVVNMAVDYFTVAHPDYEPTLQAPYVELIKN